MDSNGFLGAVDAEDGSPARHLALLELAPVGLFETDADGNCLFVNRRWCELAGMTPEQARGEGWVDALHPEDRDRVRREWYEAASNGREFVSEYRFRTAEGRVTWLQGGAAAVRDESGDIVGFVGALTDVTARKAAEAARDRRAAELQAIYDVAPVGINLALDPECRVITGNRALAEMLGMPEGANISKSRADAEVVPYVVLREGETIPAKALPMQRAARDGIDVRGEILDIVRGDGSRITVLVNASPVRDADGTVVGAVGICADVTALRDSQALLRSVVEAVPVGIGVADAEGRTLSMNPAGLRLYGFASLDEMLVYLDRSPGDFVPRRPDGGELPAAEWPLTMALSGRQVRDYEVRLRCRSGEERVVTYSVVPVKPAEGQPQLFVFVLHDVTERRWSEEELRRLNAELGEADRRKDEFLAMLAHELRNPVAAISNAVQLTILSDSEEDRGWSRRVIAAQVENLSRMIDDLLDVSRITRGKIELRKQDLDLRHVVNSAVEAARPLIEERKHRLLLDLVPEPLRVEGDPTRVEQILVNLLNNAAKYTESGGRITLSTRRDGRDVLIAVEDTGIGMPAELLDRAFDLFAQGDRTIARSEGGLGIGLTVVKSLVELHGGSVRGESRGIGKGSRFTVRLPLAAEQAAETGRGGRLVASSPAASSVLVVDDSVDMARSMARLLKLLGHDVGVAHDGPSAIEEAKAHRPDVILLDIGLPGMDGYQAARRLRDEGFDRTLIIAVSGYGAGTARTRSLESGFDHHLVKPVDLHSLLALIARSR